MLIIEILDYMWEHKGSLTFDAILLFFMRKWLMHEAHKILHLGREEEILWILEKLEKLTGEQYDGHPDFLKTVRTHYIKRYFFYLPKVLKLVYQQRRVKTMNQNINWATLVPCLLGAVKLILQPMGINIPDQNLNEIANGIAALATVIGIIYSHRKQGGASSVSTQPTDLISNNK